MAVATMQFARAGGLRAETCDLQFADAVGDWTGPCADGQAYGEGRAAGSNWRYEGAARDGKAQGRGTVTRSDGASYEGDFVDGKEHGQGTVTRADSGSSYKGGWREGKRHGHGIRTFADGNRYEGEWRDGAFFNGIDTSYSSLWESWIRIEYHNGKMGEMIFVD